MTASIQWLDLESANHDYLHMVQITCCRDDVAKTKKGLIVLVYSV